jgi:hypothetical protein
MGPPSILAGKKTGTFEKTRRQPGGKPHLMKETETVLQFFLVKRTGWRDNADGISCFQALGLYTIGQSHGYPYNQNLLSHGQISYRKLVQCKEKVPPGQGAAEKSILIWNEQNTKVPRSKIHHRQRSPRRIDKNAEGEK